MPDAPLRLSKLMAQRGLCSRREADDFIARGWVLVDGVRIDQLGTKVLPHQTVTLAPEAARRQAREATILLHKPVGFVSGQPEKGYRPAVDLITAENQEVGRDGRRFEWNCLVGLAPAGRLDIDSRGLLVFTQDGRLAKLLTNAESQVDKEYLVGVHGDVSPERLARLRHGLELDGRPLKPAEVEPRGPGRLRMILREGRHRQIRRMCEAVGLKVVSLQRDRVGQIRLGDLPIGRWRFLEPGEKFA